MYIETYNGFSNAHKIFCKGRVLLNYNPWDNKKDSLRTTIWNNIKKLYSKKARNHPVDIHVNKEIINTSTDSQAYYKIDREISPFYLKEQTRWERIEIHCNSGETYDNNILIPGQKARFGIISDLDDTILITNVHSIIKMLYHSLFKNPWQRQTPDFAADWFNALSGNNQNPVFYISNSPWNFYEGITLFLEHHGFPVGPVLLRDFGFYLFRKPVEYTDHKIIHLNRIFSYYPDLKFILIGDAVENDPYIYYEMMKKNPDQVKHIYIKVSKDKKRMQKLFHRKDIVEHKSFTLIRSYEDAMVNNFH